MYAENVMDQRIKEMGEWNTFRNPRIDGQNRETNTSRGTPQMPACLPNRGEVFRDLKSALCMSPTSSKSNQRKGNFEVKERNLKDYKELAVKAIDNFELVNLNLVKREYIEKADVLAKLGATKGTGQDRWVQVRTLPFSSIQNTKENLEITPNIDDWRSKIRNFILGIEIPEDRIEARKVRNQAAH